MTAALEPLTTAALEQRSDLAILAHYEERGIVSSLGFKCDDPDLPIEHFALIMRACGEAKRRTSWIIGDGILWGEAAYGEMVTQAIEETGLTPGALENLVSVCRRVALPRRTGLSFSHHECVASLAPAEQTHWLEQAERGDWSREHLRDELRALGLTRGRREQPQWSSGQQEPLTLAPPPAPHPDVVVPPREPAGDGAAAGPIGEAYVRLRPMPDSFKSAATRLLAEADDVGVPEGYMRVPTERLTALANALAQEA